MQTQKKLSTQMVADMAGVHKDTLLRWLREGVVNEPARDRRGWREFAPSEANKIVAYARAGEGGVAERVSPDPAIDSLREIEWDFTSAKTTYLTHGIHPYPAKFIPQIPNALIQELSTVGDTIADIFCGSGTTLLEALQLKRNAVGIDANPLAALISRAKTTALSDAQFNLLSKHVTKCESLLSEVRPSEGDLFYGGMPFLSDGPRPDREICEFWFLPHVVEELAELKKLISRFRDPQISEFCSAILSSIIVKVSKQDSDTRYVRREKSTGPGDVVQNYLSQLKSGISAARELSDILEDRFACEVYCQNILETPETKPFDLVVCSPPYPNAYSYHLYHRSRLLWLGHDPEEFKKVEIGSHRKYSSKGKNRATEETFQAEFTTIFRWLHGRLRDNKYACFVIGDSTLAGERIDNASLIAEAGKAAGFREAARLERVINAHRKSFNPKIGKIKTEKILILQKA
ncbi:MAG: DNA methyltransferase [Pseudomonadota bacterium]